VLERINVVGCIHGNKIGVSFQFLLSFFCGFPLRARGVMTFDGEPIMCTRVKHLAFPLQGAKELLTRSRKRLLTRPVFTVPAP
jgi:hypothetical protein